MVPKLDGCNSPDRYLANISSQFKCCSGGPLYLDGRPTRSAVPKYGILFKFNAFAASIADRNSMNANFPETRQEEMGFPGAVHNPTCCMALPKKSCNICAVISGVVFPTNNSRCNFSNSGSNMLFASCPVSWNHVIAGTTGPTYLEGRQIFNCTCKKGIPFKFKHLLAISILFNSTKANLLFTRALMTGDSYGPHNPERRSAALTKCCNSNSDVPAGVFPTNNSRLILSWAGLFGTANSGSKFCSCGGNCCCCCG